MGTTAPAPAVLGARGSHGVEPRHQRLGLLAGRQVERDLIGRQLRRKAERGCGAGARASLGGAANTALSHCQDRACGKRNCGDKGHKNHRYCRSHDFIFAESPARLQFHEGAFGPACYCLGPHGHRGIPVADFRFVPHTAQTIRAAMPVHPIAHALRPSRGCKSHVSKPHARSGPEWLSCSQRLEPFHVIKRTKRASLHQPLLRQSWLTVRARNQQLLSAATPCSGFLPARAGARAGRRKIRG